MNELNFCGQVFEEFWVLRKGAGAAIFVELKFARGRLLDAFLGVVLICNLPIHAFPKP